MTYFKRRWCSKSHFYLIACLMLVTNSAGAQSSKPSLTAFEVMQLIKQNVKPEWNNSRTDTIRIGNAADTITGIATCMFADMNILQRAVAQKCNMIITHEPTFYDAGCDISEQIYDFLKHDDVLQEKIAYINKHKLIIYRFHDNIHGTYDLILQGLADEFGAEIVNRNPTIIQIKRQKLSSFVNLIHSKLNVDKIRVMGNPDLEISRIGLVPGLAPTLEMHIGTLARKDVDAILVGEAREWEDYVYTKDAICLGKPKGAIFIGHQKSEEPGMKYCAKWLQGFISSIPVKFLANENYW